MTARYTWDDKAAQARIRAALASGITEGAIFGARHAEETLRISNYPPASTPGSPPARDTGYLSRSVTHVPATTGARPVALFGTNVHYGRHLEYGALIKVKRAKFLTVPINRELFRKWKRGTLGKTWTVRKAGKSPVIMSKLGPVAVLKKSVFVAARPWLRPSFERSKSRIVAIVRQHLARATSGGRK